ncbi:hypothetical protein Smp_130580 [Schistosoma mansoni]|uniref:hypothetical protein n=1 Tax=Schistosoma mansoni TaxID=6183 RepID=UPI0001A63FD2|nr:hypothetical protein Smp_130580 [Schistosoma mansoni]|eukprot:XP_018655345.1 hypothetical protein Smp_130580 [Schistosoma mansoni]
MTQEHERMNPLDIDEIEVSSDTSEKEDKESKTHGSLEKFVPQIYRAKFFGNTSVSEPRGDFICERSLGLLKTQLLTSKLHKKRIRILIDTSGISVISSRNSTVHHVHKFENITFIWIDPCDLQSCGIIVKQTLIGDNVHQFYGYKLYQNTQKLIGVLKHIYSNLELLPPNEDILSKSENSTDTKIFDTTEENNPDLIQLIDISDNTVSSNQNSTDNGNIQKQYTSNGHNVPCNKDGEKNWITFDDHFEYQGTNWANSTPTNLMSQNLPNQSFGNNDLHFYGVGSNAFSDPFHFSLSLLFASSIWINVSACTTKNSKSVIGIKYTLVFPMDDQFCNWTTKQQIQTESNNVYTNNKNVTNNPFYNLPVNDTHLNVKQTSPLDTIFDIKLFN